MPFVLLKKAQVRSAYEVWVWTAPVTWICCKCQGLSCAAVSYYPAFLSVEPSYSSREVHLLSEFLCLYPLVLSTRCHLPFLGSGRRKCQNAKNSCCLLQSPGVSLLWICSDGEVGIAIGCLCLVGQHWFLCFVFKLWFVGTPFTRSMNLFISMPWRKSVFSKLSINDQLDLKVTDLNCIPAAIHS